MNTLFVGNQPDPEDRTKIEIAVRDYVKYASAMRIARENGTEHFQVDVLDHISGRTVTIADEDCGLSCRCALRFVEGDK